MLNAIIRAILRALAYRAVYRLVPGKRRARKAKPMDWE